MRRHFPPRALALFALFALAFAIAACSQAQSDPPPPTASPTNASPAQVAPPDPASTEDAGTTTTPDAGDTAWTWPVLPKTSAGCGVSRADAYGVEYTTPGGRTFHVWGPQGYDPNKAYPVVYTFHGMQTNGTDFEAWFQMEQYVHGEAFVVYPDAINGFWDLSGTSDLTFFDDMSKMMNETYCTNPSRALGFGFSYGGIFMNHLGCKRAGYVRAIAIGEGSGNPGTGCGRLPVLFTARTADTNETVAGARAAASAWEKTNGCTSDTVVSDATMNCTAHTSCASPGALTFCEDTYQYPAGTDPSWNHTVREPYRTFTYDWFAALP
jgi:polyhydroxybutyrate depolymerase